MSDQIRLKKGLDLPIAGAALCEVTKRVAPGLVAVKPTDFRGMVPRLLVKEGDAVKAGTPLFADKKCTDMVFCSPVSGTVDAIVRGDMMWTCESVGNILKNCMEHTPSGGLIEILVKDTPIYCEIVIRDTGSGIDPEDLPHVFERFYRGKVALNTSIGIGLALSKMIVDRQSGTIRATNRPEPEKGAQFTIRFYKTTR